MQQSFGNRSVNGLLQRRCACGPSCECGEQKDEQKAPALQAKLAVSAPGDAFEMEADRIAGEAMNSPVPEAPREVGRRTAAAPASVFRALESGGQALEGAARDFFEQRLGADFSGVRIHTGAEADRSARDVNALAYTVGNHMVFRAGQYSPGTSGGRGLLAHELVHTIQQGSAGRALMRRHAHPDCAQEPEDKWIDEVTVDQAEPQTVTVHWLNKDKTDGGKESGPCSTGKGHCCVAPGAGAGGACSAAASRIDGSNCTPIGTKTVQKHVYDHGGVMYWTEIDSGRAIALHEYWPVDGTPLSHGCIRLKPDMAVKIFCGARDGKTKVHIVNEARPMCDHPKLQEEWKADFEKAATDPLPKDGEARRQVLETRRELESAFGGKHTPAEYSAMTAKDIPRCRIATVEEEAAAEKGTKRAPSEQQQVLASSGFDVLAGDFEKALKRTRSFQAAQKTVETHAARLWKKSTSRAQSATPDVDDRPHYLAHLRMMRILRLWSPGFKLPVDRHEELLALFEDIGRGRKDATFTSGEDVKKILVSGFDPFDQWQGVGNPSGAAALAMDGRTLSSPSGAQAEVQGVIFPVRFPDFDEGAVETFFGPYLTGTTPPNMIMTISQQPGTKYTIEKYAAKARGVSSADNLGLTGDTQRTGKTSVVAPPNLDADKQPEFIETTLPGAEMQKTLGQAVPLEIDTSKSAAPSGRALRGSGGNFLSNEIFYRTALLRYHNQPALPTGHLHVPEIDPTADPAAAAGARDQIVKKVEQIVSAAIDEV